MAEDADHFRSIRHLRYFSPMDSVIRIVNARQNNLKGISVDLPHRQLIVVTGPSGSGKSTLAFDTLYAEGQRRYIESLSTYAKQFLDRMPKPQVDRLEGLAPAVAIEQRNPVISSRSTVPSMRIWFTSASDPPMRIVPLATAVV